jgi:hypothetical protein
MTRRLHSPPPSKEVAKEQATETFRRWLDAEYDKGKSTWDIHVSIDPSEGAIRLRFRPPYEDR